MKIKANIPVVDFLDPVALLLTEDQTVSIEVTSNVPLIGEQSVELLDREPPVTSPNGAVAVLENWEDLSNSRPLDVHRWSEFPEVRDAVSHIFNEIAALSQFAGNANKAKHHLRVVILDLYHRFLEDAKGYVGYSRDRNHYIGPSRYNKLFIKYRPLINVVDALEHLGYITHKLGFKDRVTGIGYQSRIRATPKLISLIEEQKNVTPKMISRAPDEELLILRDADGDDIDYEESECTKQKRELLIGYNRFLASTHIDIELQYPKEYPFPIYIDLTNKKVERIFNNGSWEEGGRFYGGWWQNAPKILRERIYISNHPSVEMDYHSLHIVLMYAMKGIDIFSFIHDDPYLDRRVLSGYRIDEANKYAFRSLLKQILLTAVNANNRATALKAIFNELNMNKSHYPVGLSRSQINEILSRFEKQHAPIYEFFYSGIGVKLQYLDSLIAEKVIQKMTFIKYLPVLVIHDSFICAVRDDDHLKECLIEGATELFSERGYSALSPKIKEIPWFGWKYDKSDDDFVNEALDERYLNSDLQNRLDLWWGSKQQTYVKHIPTV